MIAVDEPKETVAMIVDFERAINDILEQAANRGIAICPEFTVIPRVNQVSSVTQYHVHVRVLPYEESGG